MNEENLVESSAQTPPTQKSKMKQLFKELFIFVIIAFGIVLPFRMFIAEPYIVSGRSMYPTFDSGHYLIVDKLSYETGNPQRNAVIVFKFPEGANIPEESGKNLIKRVIGLPKDTVIINNNEVIIKNESNPDGFALDQSYVDLKSPSAQTIVLKENEYFVMGDNRRESFDSRSWGILERKDIVGRPILRLWPLGKIGFLPGEVKSKI